MKIQIFEKKNRVWLIGGAVVLAILLFFVMRGRAPQSSGGGTQYVSSGPSEAAQIQMAQIGATLQGQQNELRALEFRGALERDVAMAQIQGELGLAGIQAQSNSETLAAQLSGLGLQLQAQQNIAQLETSARLAETAAFRDVTIAATNANYDMFALQTQANLEGQRLQADTWNTSLLTQRDIEVARIGSSERIQLGQQGVDRSANSQANSTARRGQTLGFVGSVIGGIASIFSDVRAKSGIVQIGETTLGVPLYEYTINFNRQIGVMAQEIALYDPSLVRMHESGYLLVDYDGING